MTRFIVLRSGVNSDGTLRVEGLTSITRKASGVVGLWINLVEATTNLFLPEECDLLSFSEDEVDELEQNLAIWNIAHETVVIMGVENADPQYLSQNEPPES